MAVSYTALEPDLESTIGGGASFTTASVPTLFTSASFVYTFAFVVIVVAASFRYAYAGALRMSATQKGIQESKGEFKRVTYGLLGVFALWLILYTVNKDMLTGNVSLSGLKVGNVVGNPGSLAVVVPPGTAPSGTSKACDDEATVKASVLSGTICGNSSQCSLSSTCLTNNPYISFIKSESARLGVDYKMIVVTMCKESGANPEASGKNPGGSYDCGIMQINQSGPCDNPSVLRANVNANITAGISLMKQKILATNQSYPGFPNIGGIPVAGVFASYNCCANGTSPNSPSASCTSANGWPSIPKWACPIDPGTGTFNMCGVKSYACDLTNCLGRVP